MQICRRIPLNLLSSFRERKFRFSANYSFLLIKQVTFFPAQYKSFWIFKSVLLIWRRVEDPKWHSSPRILILECWLNFDWVTKKKDICQIFSACCQACMLHTRVSFVREFILKNAFWRFSKHEYLEEKITFSK